LSLPRIRSGAAFEVLRQARIPCWILRAIDMQKECPRPIRDAFGQALNRPDHDSRPSHPHPGVLSPTGAQPPPKVFFRFLRTWLDHWLTRFWLWFERIPVEAPSLAIETSLRPARGCLAYSSSSDIPGSPGLFCNLLFARKFCSALWTSRFTLNHRTNPSSQPALRNRCWTSQRFRNEDD
jgi:hypothetical protein